MAKEVVWYCDNCSIEWKNLGYHLDACPKCSNENIVAREIEVRDIHTEDDIKNYIDDALSQADGYITSNIPCWNCGGIHYMVWPGKRDPSNYKDVTPLLHLPQCPIRVWRMASSNGLGMPLPEFLKSLEVGKDE